MKRSFGLPVIVFILLLCAQQSFAFISPAPLIAKPAVTNETLANPRPSPFAGMTIKDFLALTPRKYRELTGEKMSVSQKLSLKIAQYKVKRMVKKNKNVDLYKFTAGVDTTDFSIGGFVLGILLGPIGILIAYLIGDRSLIKWAWIGGAVWLALFLLVVIL